MNAALISGLLTGLAGVIAQNAWYYTHLRRLRWLSVALEVGGALLLARGADMAHRSIIIVVIAGAAFLAVAGSLAFVAFMAEVKHQGWIPVVKRMTGRERQP